MVKRRYAVEVIMWVPQTVKYEIEANNVKEAGQEAMRRTHAGEYEEYTIDSRPIRTTLLRAVKSRATQRGL